MTTDVENKTPVSDDAASVEPEAPHVAGAIDDHTKLLEEIDRLVELTKHKVDRDGQTPCPSCTILVDVQLNRCPHCESNIAANNALMRESMRRLGEIRAELDGRHHEHAVRSDTKSHKPSLRERIKQAFSGPAPDEQPESTFIAHDASAPRILSDVSPGDDLKVLETDGPWFKVKTRQGKTGWVYSTLVRDR